ncbi:MAG: S46 family peptidase [Planctomycetes bacterium]|nr:S46 family peptidase [Planctomycetota bacterium]MCB9920286.1 S46 family peptidase [Planctomycetota bacterium]
MREGTFAPWRTSFQGLYARNAAFANGYPFTLPKIWLDREDAIEAPCPINFVSTNDVGSGAPGSVIVNQKLEVVGVLVGGTLTSLRDDFVFDNDTPRAVSVHVDGILEALRKVYDARRRYGEAL